jgi:alpha-glucosidase (family GH31 glycosyl hydrolase)
MATYKFFESKKQRPFIISRSNSVGTGHYSGIWTGDNVATWEFLRLSVAGNFLSQIFGIQMVGADICGFDGNTTDELCARWFQLGALYPFSRTHNVNYTKDQEPFRVGQLTLKTSNISLRLRYSILKQYYSIFVKMKGLGSLFRPLFFEFPDDADCYLNHVAEEQFMIG